MSDEDDPDLAPVFELRPGIRVPPGMPQSDESPAELSKYAGSACRHNRVWLDIDYRTVSCKRCGAVVDPYDHLLKLAAEWSNFAGWVRRAKYDRRELKAELEELKRQRRNLRAQVKRCKKAGKL
jgi:hypothetical protein